MKPLRPWGEAEESDYQERAAILEYDANLPRSEAEHTARWMVARSSGAVPPKARQTRQAGTAAPQMAGWLPGLGVGQENASAAKCGDLAKGDRQSTSAQRVVQKG